MLGLGGEVWVLGWALVSGGGDKKYKISKKYSDYQCGI